VSRARVNPRAKPHRLSGAKAQCGDWRRHRGDVVATHGGQECILPVALGCATVIVPLDHGQLNANRSGDTVYIICPNQNCGYRGEAARKSRGSTALGCLLTLFLLVPGILYFIFSRGYRYYCPKCGLQIASDN
jgi:hypothetical protein